MSHPIESTVYIGLGDKKSVYQSSCEIFIAAEKLFSPTLFSCLWFSYSTCNKRQGFLTLLVAKVSREIEKDRDIQRERARKRDREGKERGEE